MDDNTGQVVLSVRQDEGPDGALAWQMNAIVFDRESKDETKQILREGDGFAVGETRYRLVRVVGPADGRRGYGLIEPVSGGLQSQQACTASVGCSM